MTFEPTGKLKTAAALLITLGGLVALPQQGIGQQATTGDPVRGRFLFTDAYKCYACHGYDAQTGERRLVPMIYAEAAFTTFVQNSPLRQMPMFADVADQDLADIYAYILTIPVDAPAVEEIPLLSDIAARQAAAMEE